MTDVCSGLPEQKLTTAEENALSKRGTPAAHNKLVMHNMREAIKYTKRVCSSEISDEELLSVCYLAMMKAARRFKPNWARFFAFSKAHLRGAVKEHFGEQKTVKRSSTISREELRDIILRQHNDENLQTIDVEALTGEIVDADFKSIKLREQWDMIAPMLTNGLLSERESMILDLFYVSGFTFADIGKKLGVTCEAIRHVHGKALKKIRNKLLSKHQLYSDC